MKTWITALAIGIFIGAGGYWLWSGDYRLYLNGQNASQKDGITRSHSNEKQQTKNHIEQIIKGKLEAMELHADSIRSELRDTGRVVRHRTRDLGSAVMDTAKDVKITTAIKAKFAADSELSAWKISVDTSSRIVTLSGKVSSSDLIGRAIMLALETEDVTQVISTIQVSESVPDSIQIPVE